MQAIGHDSSCLEQIGHLQCRLGGTEQRSGPQLGESLYLARHVRLIGVAGIPRKIRQAVLSVHLARGLQKTLETQHGLERLWAVADGS